MYPMVRLSTIVSLHVIAGGSSTPFLSRRFSVAVVTNRFVLLRLWWRAVIGTNSRTGTGGDLVWPQFLTSIRRFSYLLVVTSPACRNWLVCWNTYDPGCGAPSVSCKVPAVAWSPQGVCRWPLGIRYGGRIIQLYSEDGRSGPAKSRMQGRSRGELQA